MAAWRGRCPRGPMPAGADGRAAGQGPAGAAQQTPSRGGAADGRAAGPEPGPPMAGAGTEAGPGAAGRG